MPARNRASRKPSDASGGYGGLQMSLHIGEWWRGLKFENRGWADSGHVEAPWTGGFHRPPGWNSIDYGSYSVVTRDNQGQLRSPFQQTMGLWTRYPHPVAEPYMHLSGGGGTTMACVGAALVMMHGVPRDHAFSRVWPTEPKGSDGSDCWSAPRPLVLRANTEMRCEPDLSQEYPMTADFWARFRNHSNGRSWELQYATGKGPTRYAWENGPSDFRSSGYTGPYTWARRGEFAVFTVARWAGRNSLRSVAIAIGLETPIASTEVQAAIERAAREHGIEVVLHEER